LCNYYTSQTSSLKFGYGNVDLLFDRVDADIALFYSNDLLKKYDINGIVQTMSLSYDFDRDGKARKIFENTDYSKGTTGVDYECVY
jgi:hypothetical protein